MTTEALHHPSLPLHKRNVDVEQCAACPKITARNFDLLRFGLYGRLLTACLNFEKNSNLST